jgi:hypothetical protein
VSPCFCARFISFSCRFTSFSSRRRAVAAQVAFESKGLKPGFHFIGERVETRRFQSYESTKQRVEKPFFHFAQVQGLETRRFQSYGSTGFNKYSPTAL